MNRLPLQGRTLTLLAVIVPLLALFIYVGLRSGPLAPVAVTVVAVESRPVAPALFGIGTVETRYTYKLGPTFTGRLKRLDVHVGDEVKGGQVLGEMDPVDLDDRIRSQDADSTTLGHSAHDHLDTRSMLTWTPDPRPLRQAVGAQRRRFALLV